MRPKRSKLRIPTTMPKSMFTTRSAGQLETLFQRSKRWQESTRSSAIIFGIPKVSSLCFFVQLD